MVRKNPNAGVVDAKAVVQRYPAQLLHRKTLQVLPTERRKQQQNSEPAKSSTTDS